MSYGAVGDFLQVLTEMGSNISNVKPTTAAAFMVAAAFRRKRTNLGDNASPSKMDFGEALLKVHPPVI